MPGIIFLSEQCKKYLLLLNVSINLNLLRVNFVPVTVKGTGTPVVNKIKFLLS